MPRKRFNGLEATMPTIAILNQKGGVGKTTCTVNIAAGLRERGRSVLIVDLDAQAHLTTTLGLAPGNGVPTAHELLLGQATLGQAVQSSLDMDIVPGSLRLAAGEVELGGMPKKEYRLRQALAKAGGYDYILLDCPPNLGILSINALAAANKVIVPIQAEYLALQSLSKLLETVSAVKKRFNPGLDIGGIVINRFAGRKRLSQEVAGKLEDYFGDKVFATRIRDNVALAEAPSFGKDIFSYRKSSIGAHDFTELCREIDGRMSP